MTATKTLLEGLVPHFDPNGDRSICIVTSNASSFVARNQTLAYHTSKAALKQMARFYAVKFGPQGIRVNVVSPCTFVKPESATYYAGQHELQALYKRITPLARMGTAKEVAKTVAFLCGPDASFITGQELTVDGGLSLMLQDALAREVGLGSQGSQEQADAQPFRLRRICCQDTLQAAHVFTLRRRRPVAGLAAGPSAVGNDYLRDRQPQESFALNLHLCGACGNVQIEDVVNPDLLFRNYTYSTTSSLGLVEHFRKSADELIGEAPAPADSLVIDIGSNDGSLLQVRSANGAIA